MLRPFSRSQQLNGSIRIIIIWKAKLPAHVAKTPAFKAKKNSIRTWRLFQIRNSLQNDLTLSTEKKIPSLCPFFFQTQFFPRSIVTDVPETDPRLFINKILNIPLSLTLSMFEIYFFQTYSLDISLELSPASFVKRFKTPIALFFFINVSEWVFLTWVSACIIAIR